MGSHSKTLFREPEIINGLLKSNVLDGAEEEKLPVFGDRAQSAYFRESALLGELLDDAAQTPGAREIYLHTHAPFAMAVVGGAGACRDHTLVCILESFLTPLAAAGIVRLRAPMVPLVLHRRADTVAPPCAAASLASPPPPPLLRVLAGSGGAVPVPVTVPVTILTSPWYAAQRAACYGVGADVRPLRLRWRGLSADDARCLLGIPAGDAPPPLAARPPPPDAAAAATDAALQLLRGYQSAGGLPPLAEFAAVTCAQVVLVPIVSMDPFTSCILTASLSANRTCLRLGACHCVGVQVQVAAAVLT